MLIRKLPEMFYSEARLHFIIKGILITTKTKKTKKTITIAKTIHYKYFINNKLRSNSFTINSLSSKFHSFHPSQRIVIKK